MAIEFYIVCILYLVVLLKVFMIINDKEKIPSVIKYI